MSIFIKARHTARTMEGSLQKFAKRIRNNMAQDDSDYKAGKVGAGARNPFRSNPVPTVDTVSIRSAERAKRQKR